MELSSPRVQLNFKNFFLLSLGVLLSIFSNSQNPPSIQYLMDSGFKNENNFSICASLEADSLYLGQSNYLELGDTGMHIFQIDKWGSLPWDNYYSHSQYDLQGYHLSTQKGTSDGSWALVTGEVHLGGRRELLVLRLNSASGAIQNSLKYRIDPMGSHSVYSDYDLIGQNIIYDASQDAYFVTGHLVDSINIPSQIPDHREDIDKLGFVMKLDDAFNVVWAIGINSEFCCEENGASNPRCPPISNFGGVGCNFCTELSDSNIYDHDFDMAESILPLKDDRLFVTGTSNTSKIIGGATGGTCNAYWAVDAGVLAMFLDDSCLSIGSCPTNKAYKDRSFTFEGENSSGHYNSGAKALYHPNKDLLYLLNNSSKGTPFRTTLIRKASTNTPLLPDSSLNLAFDFDSISDDPVAAFDMKWSGSKYSQFVTIGGLFVERDLNSSSQKHSFPFLAKINAVKDTLVWFRYYEVLSKDYGNHPDFDSIYYHPFHRYYAVGSSWNSPTVSHDMMIKRGNDLGYTLIAPSHQPPSGSWDPAIVQVDKDGEELFDCGITRTMTPSLTKSEVYRNAKADVIRLDIVKSPISVTINNANVLIEDCD